MNELLEKPSSSLIDRIAYKASFGFISELDKFILHIENTYFKAADVKLTKYITIPARLLKNSTYVSTVIPYADDLMLWLIICWIC